jgi:hypothetical protein
MLDLAVWIWDLYSWNHFKYYELNLISVMIYF